jgi:hypothetical protein
LDSELRRIDLDDRARAYFLEELDDGTILGEALSPLVASGSGELFTLLPAQLPAERGYEFRTGGILPTRPERYPAEGGYLVPVDSLVDVRDERFARILASDPRACCIVGELNVRPGDPHPPDEASAFWIGEQCYRWLDSGSPDISATLAVAELPWQAVAACFIPEAKTNKDVLDRAALFQLASSTVEISARAYDGEGFVIWHAGEVRP